MKRIVSKLGLVALTLAIATGSVWAARPNGATLLVIPSRYTVVKFSFNVAQLRSLYLVAYDRDLKTGATLLYAWNTAQADWVRIEPTDLSGTTLFRYPPERTVLVGDDQTLAPEVTAATAGFPNVKHVTSLNLMELVNSLNEDLKFTSSEWKWLAERHGFVLKDQNALRRRWGRYGPFGSKHDTQGAPSTGIHATGIVPVAGSEEATLPAHSMVVAPEVVPATVTPAPVRQTLIIPAPVPPAEPSTHVVTPEKGQPAPSPEAPTEAGIEKVVPPAPAPAPENK